jgi:hypothetical protein
MKELKNEEEKKYIKDLYEALVYFLKKRNVSMQDGVCVLTSFIVTQCQHYEVEKSHLLDYISNFWEANDPENT